MSDDPARILARCAELNITLRKPTTSDYAFARDPGESLLASPSRVEPVNSDFAVSAHANDPELTHLRLAKSPAVDRRTSNDPTRMARSFRCRDWVVFNVVMISQPKLLCSTLTPAKSQAGKSMSAKERSAILQLSSSGSQ